MGRFRLCLVLLLPVLAACAEEPRKPEIVVPIPALSYEASLDGKVTPIASPIVVRHTPYPAAAFERLVLARATANGAVLTSTERVSGKTFAEASGDLIACTFVIEDIGWNGRLPASTREFAETVKGLKVTFYVAPFGPVKKMEASVTTARQEEIATIQDHLRDDFSGDFALPPAGFRQGDQAPIHDSFPGQGGKQSNAFQGKATVQGKGTYRGRQVVVFEVAGTGIVNGEPMGLRAYRFLDVATGLWSHSELIAEMTLTGDGTIVPLRFQVIDDIHF
jgi:hypothetical protein